MNRIYDLLGLLAFTAVAEIASIALDPVGAEARRSLTDERLAAFVGDQPA